eukprot:gene7346-biopygen10566
MLLDHSQPPHLRGVWQGRPLLCASPPQAPRRPGAQALLRSLAASGAAIAPRLAVVHRVVRATVATPITGSSTHAVNNGRALARTTCGAVHAARVAAQHCSRGGYKPFGTFGALGGMHFMDSGCGESRVPQAPTVAPCTDAPHRSRYVWKYAEVRGSTRKYAEVQGL